MFIFEGDLDELALWIDKNFPQSKIFLNQSTDIHYHRNLKAKFFRKFEDSGINVGQKSLTGSHVNIDDCYVPIRSSVIDELPELFPNQGINVKVGTGWGKEGKKLSSNAEFLFDDGEVMPISFEQKLGFAKAFFPGVTVGDPEVRTIFDALIKIQRMCYNDLVYVAG